MKAGDRQFDSFGVTGGSVSCHYDNLPCHMWRQTGRPDDPLFSVRIVPVLDAYIIF